MKHPKAQIRVELWAIKDESNEPTWKVVVNDMHGALMARYWADGLKFTAMRGAVNHYRNVQATRVARALTP